MSIGVMSLPDLPVLKALTDSPLASDPARVISDVHARNLRGVFRNPVESGLVVTRYDLLQKIAKHAAFQAQNRLSRSMGPSKSGQMYRLFDNHPVFMNEPLHMPVHQTAYRAIAWPSVADIRASVRVLANEIIEPLLEKEEVDLVGEYASEIAYRHWGHTLNLPDPDAAELRPLAMTIGALLAFDSDERDLSHADESAGRILEMVGGSYQRTRAGKGTVFGFVDDLIERIGHADKPANAAMLLAAMTFDAVDGAAGMSGNMLACLLANPETLAEIRDDHALISGVWTEATRVAPALLGLFRSPVEDAEVNGIRFPAGVNIFMFNAAGNRDPSVFKDPDRFNIRREEQQPLSFGAGGRACVGRSLARMQAEIALDVLLAKTSSIELIERPEDWGRPGLLRTIRRLPVRLKRR